MNDCGMWQGLLASPSRDSAGEPVRPRRAPVLHVRTYALLKRLAAAGDAGLPLVALSARTDQVNWRSQRSAMSRISKLLPAGYIKRLRRGHYAIAPGGLMAIARREAERAGG
jgi:hypothetical protein